MNIKADTKAEADRLRAYFEARGAEVFEADILQPAGALLNLYGEDIRARAFVTHDPLKGEMMLRPDFTVPLVQRHLETGRGAARYTYSGEVFRRQEDDAGRPNEYLQVGYEVLGADDEMASDAEVFAAMAEAVGDVAVTRTIGDFSLIVAAIQSLDTPDRRKTALMRHLWRPQRFNALLDRFSQQAPPPPDMPAPDLPHVGLRSREEIAARVQMLAQEAETAPLGWDEVALLRALLRIKQSAPDAVAAIKGTATGTPAITAAADRLAQRLEALDGRGIDCGALVFEASFGLTSLEYYSGFVFGFSAHGHVPLVTGGRYDMLSSAMSEGAPLSAVGAVIRPEVLLALRGRT